MDIEAHIKEVLAKHILEIQNGTYKTQEAKDFIIKTTVDCVWRYLECCKTIREVMPLRKTGDWRVVSNIQDELLGIGQRYAGFLWLANLRDSITDPINYTYGVDCNALGTWEEVTDEDGTKAYIAYDPRKFARHKDDSYTMAKDGKCFFVKEEEFRRRFTLDNSKG
jgi:hypothetical protein